MPDEHPVEGDKTMKTPSLSKGLRFRLFSNDFNFVGIGGDTLS